MEPGIQRESPAAMALRSCVVGGRGMQAGGANLLAVPLFGPTACANGGQGCSGRGGRATGWRPWWAAGQTHVTCKERAGLNGAFLRIPESVKHSVEQQPTSRTLARRCQSRGRRCQAAQQLSTHGLQSFDGRMLVLAPARPRGSQKSRSAGSIRRARLAKLQERGPTSGRAW